MESTSIAYSEVYEILKNTPEELVNKIPNELIEKIKNNRNKNYQLIYNYDKPLNEQNISEKAKSILAVIYCNYWSDQTKRNAAINAFSKNEKTYQEEASKKYDINKAFERNKKLLNNTDNLNKFNNNSEKSFDENNLKNDNFEENNKIETNLELNANQATKKQFEESLNNKENVVQQNFEINNVKVDDENDLKIEEEGSNAVKISAGGKEIILYKKETFFDKIANWIKSKFKF